MSSLTMRCAARSEQGRRANNEDAVFCSPRLVAVADGVGGAAAGEVASRWAINEMSNLEKSRLTSGLKLALKGAVQRANSALRFLIDCRPELSGMGTTLTAVALSNDGRYVIANVGDSRTYLYRGGELQQLTRDQSFVQELIDRGLLSREDARRHPQRSLVLEALDGTCRTIAEPELHRARVGDRLRLAAGAAGLSVIPPNYSLATARESVGPSERGHTATLVAARGYPPTLIAVATVTAIPARIGARRPIAEVLRFE
jgi:protein phosphatase